MAGLISARVPFAHPITLDFGNRITAGSRNASAAPLYLNRSFRTVAPVRNTRPKCVDTVPRRVLCAGGLTPRSGETMISPRLSTVRGRLRVHAWNAVARRFLRAAQRDVLVAVLHADVGDANVQWHRARVHRGLNTFAVVAVHHRPNAGRPAAGTLGISLPVRWRRKIHEPQADVWIRRSAAGNLHPSSAYTSP